MILLLFIMVNSVAAKDAPSKSDKAAANEVMNQYIEAYMKADTDSLLKLVVKEGQIDVWGTGADEHTAARDDFRKGLERDFKEARTEIKRTYSNTMLHGDAGVVLAELSVRYLPIGQDQWRTFPPVRVTFYVEKHKDQWLIRHAHWSTPLIEQPTGHSFPPNK
ncbi:nuclear transport factor 2 family protein [Spongorhabdus nitratireducens]